MKYRAKSKRTVKIYDSNLNAEQIERVLYVNRAFIPRAAKERQKVDERIHKQTKHRNQRPNCLDKRQNLWQKCEENERKIQIS